VGVEGGTAPRPFDDDVDGRTGRVGDIGRCGDGGVTSVWRMEVKIALACSG